MLDSIETIYMSWETKPQEERKKTRSIPSVPDFPMDFVHVFKGKGCYVTTIRLFQVTQYTIYELEFPVTVGNAVCCHSWKILHL